ncbi:unnamed protein product [Lactuca virosa]|uniref:Uncharacterized protein n=1 Tax=Lactuca virosa TaxID=75947 RepID=A0AAU9NJK9_9ASTR|nr:unnamed protein product [Lactuca virosa]
MCDFQQAKRYFLQIGLLSINVSGVKKFNGGGIEGTEHALRTIFLFLDLTSKVYLNLSKFHCPQHLLRERRDLIEEATFDSSHP